MTRGELVVVRHGESTWNTQHRWAGQADPQLTAVGREQASNLGRRSNRFGGAVAASDLVRARETASIVARELSLGRPTVLPDLRERWSKTLTGLTTPEINARFPGQLAAWRDGRSTDLPGESEPFRAFVTRVLRGLQSAAELAPRVLVVAHAGVFRVLGHLCRTSAMARMENTHGRRITVTASGLVDGGPIT